MGLTSRDLGEALVSGSFTDSQNFAILVAGLSCACLSLVASVVTLRWFIVMKQLFRHRLVMYLIMSDTFKGIWYFVFSVVVISGGHVKSSSRFCQASGFLLAFSIEASDFAVLVIAIHSVLYVTRPPAGSGSGGLYPYRQWIPVVWLLYPTVAASLAFVNPDTAYVTAGTYCYLPVRPFWYRLALAWIPRYLIFLAILAMYGGIYFYVHYKFRGFKNIMRADTPCSSAPWRSFDSSPTNDEKDAGNEGPDPAGVPKPDTARSPPHRRQSRESTPAMSPLSGTNPAPWDSLDFITTKPMNPPRVVGVASNDFATRGSASTDVTWVPTMDSSPAAMSPKQTGGHPGSEGPISPLKPLDDSNTTLPVAGVSGNSAADPASQDPVHRTRRAIRQQLRFLFIYPALYLLLWIIPFVNHCFFYSDYYVQHPIFWLQLLTYCCVALQAGFDCVVFSWREKPWRRIDNQSRLSVTFWRQQSFGLVQRISRSKSFPFSVSSQNPSAADESAASTSSQIPPGLASAKPERGLTWWEAEGKKRKDSVWLGTDLLTQIASRASHKHTSGADDRPASQQTDGSDTRSASG